MPTEHRSPSQATVKELYANAFRCAYQSCKRPLYKVDPELGDRSLNSNVAHICARSEGGPRWSATQTEDENRSASNLLILCLEHASEIDKPHRVAAFPVELLQRWKQDQLKDFDAIGGQGWILTPEMADIALRASEGGTIINESVLNFGGAGGNASGAGGGGGGAFGANARGGDGGPGGNTNYEGVSPDEYDYNFKLPLGENFGAGGGGAAAWGDNAVGGGGGGGGDLTIAKFTAEELSSPEGPISVEVHVGEGGVAAEYPGEHGGNGGDTELRFVAPDGRTVRSIKAKGGVRGLQGSALPPGAREVTSVDVGSGVSVPALILAEALHTKNGLLYVLGGAAECWSCPSLPAEILWPVAVVVSLGQVDESLLLTFYVVVDDPDGQEIIRLPFNVFKGTERPVANFTLSLGVQFKAKVAGTWAVRILSGDYEFSRLPVEIRINEA